MPSAQEVDHLPRALVLGAGASRSVSYAPERMLLSPLDSDFFDILDRLEPDESDFWAVRFVQNRVAALPPPYRASMERAFYAIYLKAYLVRKLGVIQTYPQPAEIQILEGFARCIQAVLRCAHGMALCKSHRSLARVWRHDDMIVSFNYDLVIERALQAVAVRRNVNFGPWIYGLSGPPVRHELPTIFKLHGSSTWELSGDKFEVLTKSWRDFDVAPGYVGCEGGGTVFPILLPFWDKQVEQKPWSCLWKDCLSNLAKVGTLVVWGYSLPPTDVKAQLLFGLGLGDRKIRLCVIDPSPATRDRWRQTLPKAMYWGYDTIDSFFADLPEWWHKR